MVESRSETSSADRARLDAGVAEEQGRVPDDVGVQVALGVVAREDLRGSSGSATDVADDDAVGGDDRAPLPPGRPRSDPGVARIVAVVGSGTTWS